MAFLRRKVPGLKKWVPVNTQSTWNVVHQSLDPDEKVNCPYCGKKLPWKDTYPSTEIEFTRTHESASICYDCKRGEIKRFIEGA